MLKNLIGKYKKRRREEISNPTPSSSSSTSSSDSTSNNNNNNNNIASVLFHCREGSVTHYYHFFFGALIPLIEYHLANPSKVLRILTDVGPFKSILCELPITISDLLGPNLSLKGHFHDDKSLNQMKQIGEVSLKGYDCFNNEFFNTSFFPKPPKATIQAIQKFFHDSIPFYIAELPTYDVILIQRAQDVYYQTGGCADRDKIYQTSGSERRSITNHVDLVNALRAQCNEMGKTFCNISLERTSVYYQYHMFSKAKVVIAQHGAALANIFFMAYNRSSVKSSNEKLDGEISSKVTRITSSQPAVIEISPPWSREFDHFKNLAAHCEVAHSALPQEEDHSEVDIPAVVTLVRSALEVI
jgi:hypothetical protein